MEDCAKMHLCECENRSSCCDQRLYAKLIVQWPARIFYSYLLRMFVQLAYWAQ